MIRWTPGFLFLLPVATVAAQTPKTPAAAPGHAGHSMAPIPAARASSAQVWTIDTAHSEVVFSIRHTVNRVRGRFDIWSGTLTIPANDWTKGVADVTIQATSINTDNNGRDNHLRSDDFFDVKQYPTITFKSTRVTHTGDSVAVAGNLTVRGVTKPVVLAGKFLGVTSGSKPRISFKVATTINRVDYGVTYNRMIEGGGTLLSDDVTIEIAVVAAQQS